MSTKEKISPAFEPFLAESGRNDKREAIVIYRAPAPRVPVVSGRLRQTQKRLDYLKERAAVQRPVAEKLFRNYQRASSEKLPGDTELEVSAIGSNALPITAVEVTRRTIEMLADQPDVVAIMPSQKIGLIKPRQEHYEELSKQETHKGVTWGLERLEIPKLWEVTQGEHINVAVLDTGVYSEHEALEWQVDGFVMIDPLGRRIETETTFDCGRHGTHVCGTIAGGKTPDGISIGVAPKAKLFVAAVLVGDATLRTLVEGISWAVERGADIINMSLGFSYYEPLFAQVFDMLLNEFDILPVVAIGNDSHGNSSSPGNVYSAFSVGAVEMLPPPQRRVEVAFFSSGASLVFPDQEPHTLVAKPDVVAPGAEIFSSIPPEKRPDGTYQYSYMDGTSMAAPHVSGVAALLMAAKPEAPVSDIVEVLKETAKHPKGNKYRPDNRWGYGLVQPVEALKALG